MLKKYLKSTIIVLLQFALPGMLLLLLAPVFLKKIHSENQWQYFLSHYQPWFFLGHILFYLMLFFLWPYGVQYLIHRQSQPPFEQHIKTAIHARIYLIAALFIFELLIWLR